jgi:hypothetical protein
LLVAAAAGSSKKVIRLRRMSLMLLDEHDKMMRGVYAFCLILVIVGVMSGLFAGGVLKLDQLLGNTTNAG